MLCYAMLRCAFPQSEKSEQEARRAALFAVVENEISALEAEKRKAYQLVKKSRVRDENWVLHSALPFCPL